MQADLSPFDALVLMSFGGPEQEEDVLPFLQNVTAGRGIPDERLKEVGEHYYQFGGRSPINEQNRSLLEALRRELETRGITTPLLWGNRNWKPFLADAVRSEHQRSGARKFLAIDTSAYSSYSSCRQYREDFAAAQTQLLTEGIHVDFEKIRQYYNHPGFAQAQLSCVREALEQYRAATGSLDPDDYRVLYVTHSIPSTMQENSERHTNGYRAQHEELIDWLSTELEPAYGRVESELVYCSRSGSPHTPWLEPDINDRMKELSEKGVGGVVVVPIGFVSDHMEVKYDLDTEAAQTAKDLQMDFVRAATVGIHPEFVAGLIDLAVERAEQVRQAAEEIKKPVVTGTSLSSGSGACSRTCCEGSRLVPTQPNWPAPSR